MKKLLLILCALILAISLVLTGCGGEEPDNDVDTDNNGGNSQDGSTEDEDGTEDGKDDSDGKDDENTDGENSDNDKVELPENHTCTYSESWSSDENEHWHESVCTDHEPVKKDNAVHTDSDVSGECDTCEKFMYHVVKIFAPDNVTLSDKILKVDNGETVEFTAEVSNKFVLSTDDAKQTKIQQKEKTDVYTFTLSGVKASCEIVIEAEQMIFVTDVAWGEAEFDKLDAWNNFTSFDVELTESGEYVVFCDVENVSFFRPFEEIKENGSVYGGITEFEISKEQVGNVTITAEFFDIDFHTDENGKPIAKPGFDFFWQIISRDTEMTLKKDSGEGYILPSNTDFTLHTVIAKPGFYWISSNSGVTWNDSLGYGMFIRTHEPNEQVDIVVKCNSSDESSFEFDWNIAPFEQMTLESGDNKLPLLQGEYTELHYTVETEGAYRFDVSDINTALYYWVVSEDTGYEYLVNSSNVYYTEALKPGDEVILFVCNNSYDVEEEIVEVTYIGYGINAGDSTAYATEEGYVNTFINPTPDPITYAVSIPDGYSIGIIKEDGSIEWTQYSEITVNEYSVYSFVVKGTEGEVELEINTVYYQFQLEVGNNEIQVVPGKEYEVTITGIDFYSDFSVNWDNSDLTALWNYAEYESGEVIKYQFYVFNFIYTGDSPATINVTLTNLSGGDVADDPDDDVPTNNDPLALGENTVNIYSSSGTTVSFTAEESGSYVINKTTSSEDIMLFIESESVSTMVEFPYTFELEAGETIEFVAFTLVPGETGIASVTITKG